MFFKRLMVLCCLLFCLFIATVAAQDDAATVIWNFFKTQSLESTLS